MFAFFHGGKCNRRCAFTAAPNRNSIAVLRNRPIHPKPAALGSAEKRGRPFGGKSFY